MSVVKEYINRLHDSMEISINTDYVGLYESFNNKSLQEIFSTIHHTLVENYSAMNTRLPTGDTGDHFWATNSKQLIYAIDLLRGIERELNDSEFSFSVVPYYDETFDNSLDFLKQSGGSEIPPHMDKIEIYEIKPIFIKKDVVAFSSTRNGSLYSELHKLGKGSYAETFWYYDEFYNRKFVVKRANSNLDEKELVRFKREYEVMSNLHSPYVVEVYNFFEDKNEYVMEYMDCTLGEYIINEKPNINKRIGIVCQVFRAFEYIHSSEKIKYHRDISPSNVLLKFYDDVFVVKISDFGLVKTVDSSLTSIDTEFKGSFNDISLYQKGFASYDMVHETFALTKLVTFIMTGKSMENFIDDEDLKAYFQKGTSQNLAQRYKSIAEMKAAFNAYLKRAKHKS